MVFFNNLYLKLFDKKEITMYMYIDIKHTL